MPISGQHHTQLISAHSSDNRARSTGRQAARFLFSIALSALVGCSVYPLPDNVMSINTEDIVLHARCEMRSEIIDWIISERYVSPSATEGDVIAFVKAIEDKVNRIKKINQKLGPNRPIDISKQLTKDENTVRKYMDVAVAYSFDFNITENNKASADAAFKLPFTAPSVLDVDAAAALSLSRQGQRQFKAQDRWAGMIIRSDRCKGVSPRRRNLVYPLDGSIGVNRVVRTFIGITDQGGAKDSFVDTLIFTTQVGAGANAAVKLSAVPHSFRLVSAGASLSASRIDVHKVIFSLVFPRPDSPDAITGIERYDGDLNAPFDRPPLWRARYNLCVADAREREDTFKTLRETAPEVYCIEYADAFAPQYGLGTPTVDSRQPRTGQPRTRRAPDFDLPSAPRSIRPNY